MADQTVTTNINYDAASISGLLNGEQLFINGGSVTINADVRWNQQAAVFGNVIISSALGGSFLLDGTQVWEIPFSASTGNVPTQNALGSNGVTGGTSGATGELTRVWATGSLTPAAAGGAMPATGYIKLRSRTGTFQAGETITLPGGATITASNAGKRSWIHAVGRGVSSGIGSRVTVPRLGTFRITGDWYELGITNGTDNQTFQFPVSDACPAIWIETAAGSNVYEIWLGANVRWTNNSMSTTDRRGMFFGQNLTTGVITIAARGATVAGLKPPSGCRVRIPNVILSNANGSAGTWDTNYIPTGNIFRYGLSTINGLIDINNAVYNWFNNITPPYAVNITNSAFADSIAINTCATDITITNVGISSVTGVGAPCFNIQTNSGTLTITDCRGARLNTSASQTSSNFATSTNINLTRVRIDTFNPSSNNLPVGCYGLNFATATNITINDVSNVGGMVRFTACTNVTAQNIKYAHTIVGTTPNASGNSGVLLSSNSNNINIDGFSAFDNLVGVHPPETLLEMENCFNVDIRNIGSAASPYDLGTGYSTFVAVNFAAANNVRLRRIYTTGATALYGSTSRTRNILCANVWGTAATSGVFVGAEMNVRGNRFTLSTTGQNGAYGTHWVDAFTSTTAGRLSILCNEPTASTLGQCSATLSSAAGSGFTNTGSVSMKALTDVVEWTMPVFLLGITSFANIAPTITGTNTANHTLEFQWDTGSGYNGTWLALTGANLSGIGAINPATGVRLRVRATVNTASTANLLTQIRIDTVTNSTAQQQQYALPGSILNVTNLIPNSRVKVTRVDTGALLSQNTNGAATSLQFDLQYTGAVAVEARNASGSPAYQPWVTQTNISTSAATTVVALQVSDQ